MENEDKTVDYALNIYVKIVFGILFAFLLFGFVLPYLISGTTIEVTIGILIISLIPIGIVIYVCSLLLTWFKLRG